MKKISIIMLFFVLFVSVSIAQEQKVGNSIEFKDCHSTAYPKVYRTISNEIFRHVKFRIRGIDNNQKKADALLLELKKHFILKEYRLDKGGSFSAFIKKDITADQIRSVLLKQACDYDFETVQVMDKKLIESLKREKKELKK